MQDKPEKPLCRRKRFLLILVNIVTSPKKMIKLIVLLICMVVVVYQLNECFYKLRHPPITTHSRVELNESISYPALTFCRESPYKPDVMKKYGLSNHPKDTIMWKRFPFHNTTVETVLKEATYSPPEYFRQYGLETLREHVDVVSSINFNMGQCQTLIPKITTNGTWKRYGYSMLLKHNIAQYKPTLGYVPGWHLFVHDVHERFSELRMGTSGRVEYMFVKVNEEIDIRLTAQHFKKLPALTDCVSNPLYSVVQCQVKCYWRQMVADTKCRGPWMTDMKEPICNNYTSLKNLIIKYRNERFNDSACNCLEPCNSIIFSTFIMNRFPIKLSEPSTQLYIYYTTKMVNINEERINYDGTQFLADIGGSLGFLLGLSVLGFIGILEKIVVLCLRSVTWKKKSYDTSSEIESSEASTRPVSDQSTVIVDTSEKINKF